MDATNRHAQASPPLTISDPRLAPIVNFEMGLTTAQAFGNRAGLLNTQAAKGGLRALLGQPFFISINSIVHVLLPQLEQPGGLGWSRPGDGQFTPAILNTFDGWSKFTAADPSGGSARTIFPQWIRPNPVARKPLHKSASD